MRRRIFELAIAAGERARYTGFPNCTELVIRYLADGDSPATTPWEPLDFLSRDQHRLQAAARGEGNRILQRLVLVQPAVLPEIGWVTVMIGSGCRAMNSCNHCTA